MIQAPAADASGLPARESGRDGCELAGQESNGRQDRGGGEQAQDQPGDWRQRNDLETQSDEQRTARATLSSGMSLAQ